jgi:hypothetical protein
VPGAGKSIRQSAIHTRKAAPARAEASEAPHESRHRCDRHVERCPFTSVEKDVSRALWLERLRLLRGVEQSSSIKIQTRRREGV